MEQDFYKGRIAEGFGIEVLVPNESQCDLVHEVIYHELCMGELKERSRQRYLEIIDSLSEQGAEAVILGCTEIALLVQQNHTTVPIYDTTAIHAEEAIKWALGS